MHMLFFFFIAAFIAYSIIADRGGKPTKAADLPERNVSSSMDRLLVVQKSEKAFNETFGLEAHVIEKAIELTKVRIDVESWSRSNPRRSQLYSESLRSLQGAVSARTGSSYSPISIPPLRPPDPGSDPQYFTLIKERHSHLLEKRAQYFNDIRTTLDKDSELAKHVKKALEELVQNCDDLWKLIQPIDDLSKEFKEELRLPHADTASESPNLMPENSTTAKQSHRFAQQQLTNHFAEIDLSKLALSRVIIGRPSIYGDWDNKPYSFNVTPARCRCPRGCYELSTKGTLTLVKYYFLNGEGVLPVGELLVGDFCLEMWHQDYDGILFVPFTNGKIDLDRSKWQGNGAVLADYQNSEAAQIRQFVEQRKISHLVHFTRLENLANILKNGLVGRDELDSREQPYVFNDKLRLDHIANSICLSVSFPNYKMFYSYRCQDQNADWVVIRLKPNILWSKTAIFCVRNAAERNIAQQSKNQRLSFQAFENMFENQDGYPTRELTQIPSYYPTNPQAEILIVESIDPTFIVDVVVDRDDKIRNQVEFNKIIDGNSHMTTFYRGNDYFLPRNDYKHWM